ncbi:MAG: membrane protein insertase YidC [Planctomycetes bacterium]|nr:membrane protein insertase YidC [Planctomycetota bacterium]
MRSFFDIAPRVPSVSLGRELYGAKIDGSTIMEQQRFILFLVLSMAVLIGWVTFGPQLFPDLFAPQKKENADGKSGKKKPVKKSGAAIKTEKIAAKSGSKSGASTKSGKTSAAKKVAVAVKPKGKQDVKRKVKPEVKPEAKLQVKKKPIEPTQVTLGSPKPDSGYFIQVFLTSLGASIKSIELNDPRYGTIADPTEPLKIVGNTSKKLRTFQLRISKIGKFLDRVDWKLDAEKTRIEQGVITDVTFSITRADGKLKISKRFWLRKVEDADLDEARISNSKGYELKMELTFENKSEQPRTIEYQLQGPVGLPLEDVQNVKVFRGIVTGFVEADGIDTDDMTAAKLVDQDGEKWENPAIRYIGIDVQYFAALVIPAGNQYKSPYFADVQAEVVLKKQEEEHSDISFVMNSKEIDLDANGGKVTHSFTLYAGPKREDLLEPYNAEDVIQFGWFGMVAQAMLWLLALFHNMGCNFGISIICLTAVVRLCMFPLSKKQATSARKMKELQPKLAELKKKHGKDRQKMAQAQMELFSKHGYNPLAGCLPIFLQLPIFIGLYQGLRNAVDLRLAPFPFTWISDLSAPDALFDLGFKVPFFGWTDFNLLPLITCALFVVQQKMFMPPAVDDQQKMQQKMMTWMSLIFVFLFYTVPSGLCVYFIASSLWGIGERKLLDVKSKAKADAEPGADGEDTNEDADDEPKKTKPPGFFGKLMAMADAAAQAKAKAKDNANSGSGKSSQTNRKNSNQQRTQRKKSRRKKKR